MGGRTAVGVALALWAGLLAAPVPALVVAALVAVVPLAWIAWRAPGPAGAAALILAAAAAGTLRGAGHHAALERSRRLVDEDALHRVVGRVVEPPLRESGEPVTVVAVESSAPALAAGARLRLRLPEDSRLEWGGRARLLARLDRPRPRANPGGYDPLGAADAAALTAAGRAHAATPLRSGPGALGAATVGRWRRAIEARFAARLPPAARELVTPLVTGDRSAVPPDLGAALRAAGLVHLLALSGLHVAWMAAIARGVAAALGGGLRARAWAGALCALLYVGLAGPLPSLLRAAATEAWSAAARLAGRALDPVQSLALAAVTLLVVAPGWGGDLGFQLSCAATLGLVALGPRLARLLPGPAWLNAAWAATLGAQLVALPVLLARFHAVSWPGLAANLPAVPISSLLLAAAWLGALADLAVPGAGHAFFAACDALAGALRWTADLAARAPGALLAAGAEPAVPALAGCGAALLALALDPPRTVDGARRPAGPRRVAAIGGGGLALALALLLAVTAPPLRPPPGAWWLVALDVGQGDAVALGFADGWWLVDAGPRSRHHDAGESAVLPFLRWAGVRRLATLAVTHDDGDHAGGVAAVRRGVAVARVVAPPALPRVAGPARRLGAGEAGRGDTLRRDPAVVAWWPPRGDSALAADNAASLVLAVGAGRGRALLAADVDSLVEARLGAGGPFAILKVAHHGAASSSGSAALATLRPRHAVVSCGRRNPFGHPAPGALERLARAGAAIHRTDRAGAVVFACHDSGVTRIAWRGSRAWARREPAVPPRSAPRE